MSGAGSQLRFRGALALPDDREPSLIVDLRLDDEVVIIMQDNEQIGAWNVADVAAERLNGQKFRLQLGDDEVIFHARDRLGFAYTGISALESAKQRQVEKQERWWFERLLDDGDTASLGEATSRAAARLRELLAAASEWLERTRAERREPGRHELTAEAATAVHRGESTAGSAAGQSSPRPPAAPTDDATSADPAEPWGLDDPGQGGPIPRSRSQLRVSKRHVEPDLDDDPWAFVADVVLRRDESAPEPEPASERPRRRGSREHVHEFDETRLPGGLVRRVCSCGEVVIRSLD